MQPSSGKKTESYYNLHKATWEASGVYGIHKKQILCQWNLDQAITIKYEKRQTNTTLYLSSTVY